MSNPPRCNSNHTPDSLVFAYDEALANGDVPAHLVVPPENWPIEQRKRVQEQLDALRVLEQHWPRNLPSDAQTTSHLNAVRLLEELELNGALPNSTGSPLTVEALRKSLVQDELVSDAEFDAAVKHVGNVHSQRQLQEVAYELVQRDVLNRHQASILCRGELPSLVLRHFLVLEEIGRGGMGVVYRAIDRRRNQHVALKTITAVRDNLLRHLKREFRAVADLWHPNLVVLDELWTSHGYPFFTMELIDGLPLDCYVRGDRVAPAAQHTSFRTADSARERNFSPNLKNATAA